MKRRVIGSVCVGLLLMTLTTTTLAQPATSFGRSSQSVRLGAVNYVKGSRTAYSNVTIPRPSTVAFEFFNNPDVKLSGGGRFTGLFLIQQDVKHPAAIYWAKLRDCYRPGCKTGYGWFSMMPVGVKWRKQIQLPAGMYRLYLFADSAPVTGVLRLQGLRGDLTIRPDHLVHSEVGTAAAHLPVNNVYSGGNTFTLPNEGLAMLAFHNESPAQVADVNGHCLYRGRAPVQEAVAYAPGCSAHGASEGGGYGFSSVPLASGGGSASISAMPNMKAGTWSFGGSWLAPQPVRFAAFTSLWMSYE